MWHLPSRHRLTKDTIELLCGKCKIQICCLDFDHCFWNLSLICIPTVWKWNTQVIWTTLGKKAPSHFKPCSQRPHTTCKAKHITSVLLQQHQPQNVSKWIILFTVVASLWLSWIINPALPSVNWPALHRRGESRENRNRSCLTFLLLLCLSLYTSRSVPLHSNYSNHADGTGLDQRGVSLNHWGAGPPSPRWSLTDVCM